jgi:hypothetical protein
VSCRCLATPAAVVALWHVWTTFLTLFYIPGSDMEEFLTLVETTGLVADKKDAELAALPRS